MEERTINRTRLLEAMKRYKNEKESLFYFLQGYFDIEDEEVTE